MRSITAAGALLLAGIASAQVTFTGTNYTQNFDSLPASGTTNTWTDNATLAGWYSSRVVLVADNGASNAGRLGSAGDIGAGDRALASLASGTTGTVMFGVQLVNNTGGTLTGFTLSYSGEQWRTSTSQQNVTTFDYRVGGTALAGADYTAASNLDFNGSAPVTTNGAVDGNAGAVAISGSITGISWGAGQSLWLRWSDIDNTGSDGLLGVDNLTFSSAPVPEPATLVGLALGAVALIRKKRASRA